MIKVTCGIIELNGKILICQRAAAMSLPNKWEFPGGKLEDNESEIECLEREIREELRIHVKAYRKLTHVVHDYGQFVIELIPYICKTNQENIVLAEHQAYKWIAPTDIVKYDLAPADIPVAKEYLEVCNKLDIHSPDKF